MTIAQKKVNYLEFRVKCAVFNRDFSEEKFIVGRAFKDGGYICEAYEIISAFLEINPQVYGVEDPKSYDVKESVRLKTGLVDLLTDFGVKTEFKVTAVVVDLTPIWSLEDKNEVFASCKLKPQLNENIKWDDFFKALKCFGDDTEQIVKSAYIDQQKNIDMDSKSSIYY